MDAFISRHHIGNRFCGYIIPSVRTILSREEALQIIEEKTK